MASAAAGGAAGDADGILERMREAAEKREREEKELDAPPSVDELIKLRSVHKTYLLGVEGVPAVRGVDLTIRRGEFIVILGKSGGGKSTLLNLMTTIDRPSRGDVWLCGTRVKDSTPDATLAQLRLRRLGFVFQSFNLVASMTAVENVELPMVLAGWETPSRRRERASALLQRVGMSHRLLYTPSQLSGGESQRVAIARALANRPDVLVGDEITGDLDPANTDIVMSILLDLNRSHGVTVVMVTHEMALKAHAHRVVHMLDGRVSRLEAVPEAVRRAADREIMESPAVLAATKALGDGIGATHKLDGPASEKHKEEASAREDVEATSASGRRRIVVRRPVDYPTHQFAVNRFQQAATPATSAGGE